MESKKKKEKPILTDKERKKTLSQTYLTPNDVYLLIENIGEQEARNLCEELQNVMEERNLYIPYKVKNESEDQKKKRKRLVRTNVFIEKIGL